MQNSQCHSLHPEKISQPHNANANIFRGSEAVFFSQPHPPIEPQHPTTHFSGAVKNKALIGCFANVLNKVFNHSTLLHFGRRKPNLPAFIPFHSLHTLFQHRTASVFRALYPCFFPTFIE